MASPFSFFWESTISARHASRIVSSTHQSCQVSGASPVSAESSHQLPNVRLDPRYDMSAVDRTSDGISASMSDSVRPVMKELELREKAVAAAAAAFLSAIIVNPLDVAKTRLQAQAAGVPYIYRDIGGVASRLPHVPMQQLLASSRSAYAQAANSGISSVSPGQQLEYKSTWDVLYKIIRQEGFGRLWRGTNAGLAISVPTVGIYLPLYDMLRDVLERGLDGKHPTFLAPYAPLIGGSVSRAIACIICSPLELARTRMQAQKHLLAEKAPGIYKTLKEALANNPQHGLRKVGVLWTGVGAQLARDVPFSAICWATLEPLRRRLLDLGGPDAGVGVVISANFGAGMVAGSLAAALTCPLDVVKTRRQIERDPAKGRKMHTFNTLVDVWREKGLRSLFTGVGPRIGRAGPAVGIVVSSYEVVKYSLHRAELRRLGKAAS